jgi:Tfp pilus assembly protein PilP
MKLMTAILVLGVAVGSAWAQNPDVIQDTHDTMKALQLKKQIDSDAALRNSAKPTARPAARTAPASPRHTQASRGTRSAKSTLVAAGKPKPPKQRVAVQSTKLAATSSAHKSKQINVSGRRDPFVSPVVSQSVSGSGCSVGKRCLAIDQIALKGVVKSDVGMIAVVVNALDKAYFLRENDPVFNGYVVRITGDSIIFKETVRDRMGKPFTREVTKKITTPAV